MGRFDRETAPRAGDRWRPFRHGAVGLTTAASGSPQGAKNGIPLGGHARKTASAFPSAAPAGAWPVDHERAATFAVLPGLDSLRGGSWLAHQLADYRPTRSCLRAAAKRGIIIPIARSPATSSWAEDAEDAMSIDVYFHVRFSRVISLSDL